MDLTTVITLTGPKANVVKMLNAGILGLGFSDLIKDCDDLGTVIQKVTGDAMVFQFQDLYKLYLTLHNLLQIPVLNLEYYLILYLDLILLLFS